MRRLFFLILIVFLLYKSWPFLTSQSAKLENIQLATVLNTIDTQLNQLLVKLEQPTTNVKEHSDIVKVEKPVLTAPQHQLFSVYNIEIGDARAKVEQEIGGPKRSTLNEYGVKWHTYHTNYQNFFMVAYDENNQVAGLYSNQNVFASEAGGIKYGTKKDAVLEQLGDPLTKILKGRIYYQLEQNRNYDLFQIDDSYVTIFYDKFENNTLSAIQIISKSLEQKKERFYAQPSEELVTSFAYQLFDLTNADRVNNGLPILDWDDRVKVTARKHSKDMAMNNYFSHTNLDGESPFDRMLADQIKFRAAGENLAFGQLSSIYAHEGLMNSSGHRKIILQPQFEFLGVGVAFDTTGRPYFTENFWAK